MLKIYNKSFSILKIKYLHYYVECVSAKNSLQMVTTRRTYFSWCSYISNFSPRLPFFDLVSK